MIQKGLVSLFGRKQRKRQIKDKLSDESYSNNVLYDGSKTYYVPAYLRGKFKHFVGLNLETLEAQAQLTLIFSVYYGNIDKFIVDNLINGIVLNFNRNDPIQLQKQQEIKKQGQEQQQDKKCVEIKFSEDKKRKVFTYTIRKSLKFRISSQIFWSPFQIINLFLTIDLKTVAVMKQNGEKYCQVKFNLMDHKDMETKLSYDDEGDFGDYNLAESLISLEYSKQRIPNELKKQQQKRKRDHYQRKKFMLGNVEKKKQLKQSQHIEQSQIKKLIMEGLKNGKKDKVQNYQYAHFKIPLYKFPKASLAKVFLPLWLLSLLTLGVFMQTPNLAQRFATISTLMIAFIALIPIIRQQIPPTPEITFIEILVLAKACNSVLTLIDSILVNNQQDYIFKWYQNWLFLLVLFISLTNMISVGYMFLKHTYAWQPSYKNFEGHSEYYDDSLAIKNWFNEQCDLDFIAQWPNIKRYNEEIKLDQKLHHMFKSSIK